MKTLFCFYLAVYLAAAVPLENAGDEYSRINFVDDDSVVSALDLEAQSDVEDVSRNADDNRYLLYTRQNRMASQTLRINNANSITLSRFNAKNPTVVIVHGWFGNQLTGLNSAIRDAYLEKSDINVIVMEWRAVADYLIAVRRVPGIGRGLGQFLRFLNSVTGAPLDSMHLVGFSLGAHVVGNAGRELGGKIARITGLDPAGPMWNLNSYCLRSSDAIYVEVIHTNGGIIGLGIGTPLGDADFFPNGGLSQPGCITGICDHNRSWEFFAASVSYDHFLGRKCSNMGQVTFNRCRGEILRMGNDDLKKKGSGIYRVNTQSKYPY